MKKVLLTLITIALANTAYAQELFPNCVARIHQFKYPLLPVKKDELRNKTGCLYIVNWGIREDDKKPEVFDIRSNDTCERIGKRVKKAWRKSILYKGEPVAHCQTKLRIKCPDPKKVCRFVFQLPEDDPVMKES